MISLLLLAILGADFRASLWGDTPKQVLAQEKLDLAGYDAESLTFAGEESERPILVVYTFANGKLHGGGLSFVDYYVDLDEYMVDYAFAVAALDYSLGAHESTVEQWSDNSPYTVISDAPSRGMAMFMGLFAIVTHWETDRSNIVAKVAADDYIPRIIIAYAER